MSVESKIYGALTATEIGLGVLSGTTTFRETLPHALSNHSTNFLTTVPLMLAFYGGLSIPKIQDLLISEMPEKMQTIIEDHKKEIFSVLKTLSVTLIMGYAFFSELNGMNISEFIREGLNTPFAQGEILPDIAFGIIGLLTSKKYVDSKISETTSTNNQ